MKALALCATLTACWLALASPASVPFTPAAPVVEKPDADADALQGVWRQVRPDGSSPSNGSLLVIDGNRLSVRHDAYQVEEAEFTVDAAAAPKAITTRFDTGFAFGIYDLRGDTLRLCISEPGPKAVRPTQFRSFGESVKSLEFRRLTAAMR